MITDFEMNPYAGSLYVVSSVNGDSGESSVYTIVQTSPPEPIQDPALLFNMVNFPTGPELRQGDQLKNIQDQNTTNNNNNKTNNNNDNNDLVICDKLQSFDNVLSDTWID